MQKLDSKDLINIFVACLALGTIGLLIARYLSSSEQSTAQEYVDSDGTIPSDRANMKTVVKDLLDKIKTLEREKTVHNDKIAALQQQAAIELEQSKFLTSNVLKSTTA